jgi:hypothetical protein
VQFNPHASIMDRTSGEPITEDYREAGAVTKTRNLTHGILVIRALDSKYKDEENLPAERGMKRFMLATRILRALDGIAWVDLEDGEGEIIKECTAKAFSPGLYGQIHVAIDEAREKAKKAVKAAASDKAA